MGEAVEKLSGKLGIDTTDFQAGVRAADRTLRVLETGFRANAAALGDWTQSATGLESRIGSLTEQIDVQRLKVDALRENYQKMAAENGENSRAAQDAAIKLNAETERLGKMETELRNSETALEDMRNANEEVGDSADEAGSKVETFKSVLSGMGSVVQGALTVIFGLALAVAGLGAGISNLVFDTATASAELVDLSAKTGITTTRLQELAYAGDQVGTSQDTIVGSLARLTRSMGTAQQQEEEYTQAKREAIAAGEEFDGQLGDSAAAFERLGVKITDAQGNLRDNEDVFADLIDALARVDNESERDALSMSLFGKSAQELNPLIKAGADELARLSEEAHNVGAVMDEDTVASFEAFDDTLASLQAGLKGTLGTLAGAFLPGFQAVFDQVGGYLQEFSSIVAGANGDIGQIAQGLGGLVTRIAQDIAAQAPQLLQTGVTILQSIVTAIITALPSLIPAAVNIILTLMQFIIENLPILIDAGLQAIIALANGLATALPQLIPAIVQAIITIVNTLLENLPMLIDAALQLILGLAQGLILALPILIAALPQIIDAIFNGLLQALPMMMDASGQLIGMLAAGLLAAIPVLLTAVGELIVRLGVTLGNFIKDAPMHGKNFITGLANGFKNSAGMLYDAVAGVINNMIAKMKDLLKIHSPSGVGEDMGQNLVGAIGSGGKREAPKAGAVLANAAQQLVDGLSGGLAGGTAGAAGLAGAGGGISIGNINVDARGASDPRAVGQAVQDSLLKTLRAMGGA
jgi:phage-related protein